MARQTQNLTPAEVAARLGVAQGTLANWRSLGTGPGYIKLNGGRVRYPLQNLVQYERECAHQTQKE